MENKNDTAVSENQNTTVNFEERLKALAEGNEQSVEDYLQSLEEKQEVADMNAGAKSRSTGSQSSESNFSFDPAGSEFLKGIWGK